MREAHLAVWQRPSSRWCSASWANGEYCRICVATLRWHRLSPRFHPDVRRSVNYKWPIEHHQQREHQQFQRRISICPGVCARVQLQARCAGPVAMPLRRRHIQRFTAVRRDAVRCTTTPHRSPRNEMWCEAMIDFIYIMVYTIFVDGLANLC